MVSDGRGAGTGVMAVAVSVLIVSVMILSVVTVLSVLSFLQLRTMSPRIAAETMNFIIVYFVV